MVMQTTLGQKTGPLTNEISWWKEVSEPLLSLTRAHIQLTYKQLPETPIWLVLVGAVIMQWTTLLLRLVIKGKFPEDWDTLPMW